MALGKEYQDTWFSWLFADMIGKISLAWKTRWAASLERGRLSVFLAVLLLLPAFRKSRIAGPVIEELTAQGKFREAINVTNAVFQDWFRRASEFERISKAAAKAGDFIHAEMAAGMIPAENSGGWDIAHKKIIECVSRDENSDPEKRFAHSWRLLEKITSAVWKSHALFHMCLMWIIAGHPDRALRTAFEIPDFLKRNGVLQSIGFTFLKQNQLNDAEQVLRLMRGETSRLFRQSFRTPDDYYRRFLNSWPPYATPNWNVFEMGSDVGACTIAVMEIDGLAMALVEKIIDHRPERAFRLARTFVTDRREAALFFYDHALIEEAIDLHPNTLYGGDDHCRPALWTAVGDRMREKWKKAA